MISLYVNVNVRTNRKIIHNVTDRCVSCQMDHSVHLHKAISHIYRPASLFIVKFNLIFLF